VTEHAIIPEQNSARPKLDIVVSVYNEAEALSRFRDELFATMERAAYPWRVIFVNDGSTDGSDMVLDAFAMEHPNVAVIHFSRNFGHEAAMLAGIDASSAEACICMDADLQHPPESIPAMMEAFTQGFEIVNMVRDKREDAGMMKRVTSSLFYAFINKISPVRFERNASDFFLVSARVARLLRTEFRERTRFIRGYTQIVGFRKTTLNFYARARTLGKSKYGFYRLMLLTSGAIATFSRLPLHLGILMGIISGIFALGLSIYSIIMKIAGYAPPGYTTIVVFLSAMFAIQFFLIGILGLYIGYIFEENKKRPIYIIDRKHGFEQA
jgi:polyisoprenyl-phosphate glycosyltransferase